MLADGFFFNHLQRLYINGQLKDIPRGNEQLFAAHLSEQWLRVHAQTARSGRGWEKAKEWQTILRGISRTAAIVYGARGYRVVFDEADEIYDKFSDDETIVASTAPANDPAVGDSLFAAVDVMTGQVIHEAAHFFERQGDRAPFGDDPFMAPLHHLAEDLIIDTLIARQFPGFSGYLLKFRRYLFDMRLKKTGSGHADKRLTDLILAVRSTHPARFERHAVKTAYLYLLYILKTYPTVAELRRIDRVRLAQQLYGILYETKEADQWQEPGTLAASLVRGKDGPPTPGKNGPNRGGENNPQPSERKKYEKSGKLFAGKNRWMEQFRHKERSDEKERALTADDLRLVRNMEDQMDTRTDGAGAGQKGGYQIVFSRPTPSYNAAQKYEAAADAVRGQIVRLRNQFSWANAGINLSQFGLTAGELDEDALYRAKFAADLFIRPIMLPRRSPKLDISLLIDSSNSMLAPMKNSGQPGYVAAQRLAALFVEALEPVDSIKTWVYAFSSSEQTVSIRELYTSESGEKIRIGDIYPAGQTPEYQALLAVSRRMRDISRPEAGKIYVICSDGMPQDDLTPGHIQIQKIKRLVKQLHHNGDSCIHVALSPNAPTQHIYPHRLVFPENGYPELVQRFGKLLNSLLKS
ncbi:MAG TPA: hypothetical protein VF260_08930 [Bacilli bacterium]